MPTIDLQASMDGTSNLSSSGKITRFFTSSSPGTSSTSAAFRVSLSFEGSLHAIAYAAGSPTYRIPLPPRLQPSGETEAARRARFVNFLGVVKSGVDVPRYSLFDPRRR